MKKKVMIAVGIIIAILLIAISTIAVINIQNKKEAEKIKEQEEKLLKEINSHYSEFVVTNKETILYKKIGECKNGKL